MGLSLNIGKLKLTIKNLYCDLYIFYLSESSYYSFHSLFKDMASAAFIEPLPVLEFVAQLLGKDVLSRPLSDSDRVKVLTFI